MIKFTIPLPPFDYSITILIGPIPKSIAYVNRIAESHFKPGNELAACLKPAGWCPFILLPRHPRTAREIGTLAHEASHAAEHLLHWTSEEVCAGEILSHTIGYIVSTVLSHKQTRRSKDVG